MWTRGGRSVNWLKSVEEVNEKEWRCYFVTQSSLITNCGCVCKIWKNYKFKWLYTNLMTVFMYNVVIKIEDTSVWYYECESPLWTSLSRSEYKWFKQLAICSRVCIYCEIWSMDWLDLSDPTHIELMCERVAWWADMQQHSQFWWEGHREWLVAFGWSWMGLR